MNVLFAGGGSGGHLYPALAIARAMVAADPRIQPFFVGAERGIEKTILPETEFPYQLLDLHPLYRSNVWLNWKTVAGSAVSWREISRIITEKAPCALVATGGYAAGVALAVARSRKLPIVIQDQNSVPGLTVRWFASAAAQLHLGFPESARSLRVGRNTVIFDSGNPIAPPPALNERPSRSEALKRWGFEPSEALTLLVFGGSQGAEAINRVVAKWVQRVTGKMVRVIWATGPANFGRYARLENAAVRVVPYISTMAQAYTATDLALTRAGASTTAELSAWGIPAVLVPLPSAAADHQTQNARTVVAAGAAEMISQADLTPDTLQAAVSRLVANPIVLHDMREKTLMRARPNAAQDIAMNILSLNCFK
ncbi:MAG: UDP-N-acetylglucosamine--N-acetylmuramyl-(pentapeptide) pyrophosphoryl-undecaprenol N-acetylglucosamine transferase [Gemmatimonadaceae bacterium]